MIRISIIIPVYNAEKFLERCVRSCLRQGIDQETYEIILCNDGSTDGSLELAQKLSAENKCVKVYSQENAGAGMARNLGLKHALGNYVIFVDSDDYIIENSLSPLLEQCESLDLDVCKYVMECIILDSGKHIMRHPPIKTNVIYTGESLLTMPQVPLDSACSSFYKRQFLETHNLCFSGQTSSEDVVFNLRLYPHAKRVMYVNNHVYTYEVRTGSRRHSTDHSSRIRYLMNNVRNAGHVMKVALSEDFLSDNTSSSLVRRANSMTAGLMMEMIKGKNIFTRDDIKEALSLAKELNVYPIKGKTFSWKTTLMAYLIFNNEWLFINRFKKQL